MKNCFAFILCLFLSLALLGKDTTSIKKETFLYAVKDKDSLFLDKYTPIKGKGETLYLAKNKPSIIFVFGGGFFTGSRNEPRSVTYFAWLLDNGFTVFSIYYSL